MLRTIRTDRRTLVSGTGLSQEICTFIVDWFLTVMTRPLDGTKEGFSANGAGMLGQMIKAVGRRRSWNLYVQLAGTKSCATTLENNLAVPQNVEHRVTLWPHSVPPTYRPKKIEHVGLHKTLLDDCALDHHSWQPRQLLKCGNNWNVGYLMTR